MCLIVLIIFIILTILIVILVIIIFIVLTILLIIGRGRLMEDPFEIFEGLRVEGKSPFVAETPS